MVKAFVVDNLTERWKLHPSYWAFFFSPNACQPRGRVKISLNLVLPFADLSMKQDKIEPALGTFRVTSERKKCHPEEVWLTFIQPSQQADLCFCLGIPSIFTSVYKTAQ